MAYASSSWTTNPARRSRSGPPRALEIGGVVIAFFYFWPLAAAYVVWKLAGYPLPVDWRSQVERVVGAPFRGMGWTSAARAGFGPGWASSFGSGNAAFDAYRLSEIERLERERARLDDEAREFRAFVDDLKRAKDREEFDAYMARRRAAGSGTTAV